MAQGAPLELGPSSIESGGRDGGGSMLVDRLIVLSSWMVILGMIRFLCTVTDSTGAFIEAWRFSPVTTRLVGWWLADNRLVFVLCASWPLVVSVALRRTRWPALLPAAAATFLVLSIGGWVALVLEWSHAQGRGGTIGSFHLTRRAFLHPTLSDAFLGMLGVVQLIGELVAAVCVLRLIPRFRGAGAAPPASKHERARQARFGRLAIYASLGFLVLMIGNPARAIYLDLLNNSPVVRNFVLRSDLDRIEGPRNVFRVELTPDERWVRNIQERLRAATAETTENEFQAARDKYVDVIHRIDMLPDGSLLQDARPTLALALNNLAWLQATCPDLRLRNAEEAVRQAKRALEIQPNEGNYWNTLGVAFYRSGEWNKAKDALSRSMELRNHGNGFDWFFLALVELKLGHKDQALDLYNKSVEWYHQYFPDNQELYRFQVEAAQDLALAKPSPPTPRLTGAIPISSPLPGLRRRMRANIAGEAVRPRPH